MVQQLFLVIVTLSIIPQFIYTKCHFPSKELDNGYFVYEYSSDKYLTEASENYLLQFRCNAGYVIKGSNINVCKQGTWSTEMPKCVTMSCGRPPAIVHAKLLRRNDHNATYTIGSIVHYTCTNGYEMENKDITSLTCANRRGRATWRGKRPKCVEKVFCSDPGFPSDGFRRGECCDRNTMLTYSCRSNHELQGEPSIRCLSGGKWSAPPPRCRPLRGSCPDPPHIENGQVIGFKKGNHYTLYEEVEIKCDPGYAFEGESEIMFCDEDWKWDVEFGKCKLSYCDIPEPPQNGTIDTLRKSANTELREGSEINYVCDDGFRLIGDHTRICEAGRWTGKQPQCEVIRCPDPGVPEHGMRTGSDFSFGGKLYFQCFDGYEAIGSVERYCKINGQWSGDSARCNNPGNFCPNPGIPINGERKGSRYGLGDIVEFRCHHDHYLVGSETRECLPSRIWSGTQPRCLGAYDFDARDDVSNTLKAALNVITKKQTDDTPFTNYSRGVSSPRIMDLNYAGRYVLYFVLDASGSIGKENFEKSIAFAKALVEKIGISENRARAGAVSFSSSSNIEFMPTMYKTTEEVLEALDKIKYTRGGTHTNSALEAVRKLMIPDAEMSFDTTNMKSVVFILTDGKANMGGSPLEEAKTLKKDNIEIYCIGITGTTTVKSLHDIASKPPEEHVFILNNYKVLDFLIDDITNGTIDYSKCGIGLEAVGKASSMGRIWGGGYVVDPWPWMAALFYRQSISKRSVLGNAHYLWFSCGGSIIQQQWVLTAAHCVCQKGTNTLKEINGLRIKLGLTDVNNHTYLQEFEAEQVYIHPEYHPSILNDDIALIKLNNLIQYNSHIRPICLPPEVIPEESPLYKPQEIAFSIGWGYSEQVEENKHISPLRVEKHLKEVELPLQSDKACVDSYVDNGGWSGHYTRTMMCAGDGRGSGNTCGGDSGGPLMQSQMNSKGTIFWTQVGITSFGLKSKSCDQPGVYGYYAHVRKLLSFIKTTINSKDS